MDGSYATKGKCLHFNPNQKHNIERECVCMSMCVRVENVEKALSSFIDASQILTCFSFIFMNREQLTF